MFVGHPNLFSAPSANESQCRAAANQPSRSDDDVEFWALSRASCARRRYSTGFGIKGPTDS